MHGQIQGLLNAANLESNNYLNNAKQVSKDYKYHFSPAGGSVP